MSEKSKKSTESVSSAKSSEVLKAPRVKRTFTAQFKEEALAMLSRQGLSVAEVARRLGVHQDLLRKWRNMAQVAGPKAFQGPAQPLAIEEEVQVQYCSARSMQWGGGPGGAERVAAVAAHWSGGGDRRPLAGE